MKWYNLETMFRSLRGALRVYLHDNGIYYELSGGSGFWHFEILTDAAGANHINSFIDSITIPGV